MKDEVREDLDINIFLHRYVHLIHQIFNFEKDISDSNKHRLYDNLYDRYHNMSVEEFLYILSGYYDETLTSIKDEQQQLKYIVTKYCPKHLISKTYSNTLYNVLDLTYKILDEECCRIGYLTEYDFRKEIEKLYKIYNFKVLIQNGNSCFYWYNKYPDIYPGMAPQSIIDIKRFSDDNYYCALQNFYTEIKYRDSNLIENGFDCALKFLKRILKDSNHPKLK